MDLGFAIPNIWVPEKSDPITPISQLILADEKLLGALTELSTGIKEVWLVPYAVTLLEEELAQRCKLALLASGSAVNARINDKIANRIMAEELGLSVATGKVCNTVEEIREVYHQLTTGPEAFTKIIIKEPYGASGKGLYIVEKPERLSSLLAGFTRYARKFPDAKWLVEGWHSKLVDLNYQLYISEDGDVELFSLKEQVLRDTVYIGSKLPAEQMERWDEAYREIGTQIGRRLYAEGYYGIAGIDSMITSDQRIIPIVEINGRFTLSTYISLISRTLGDKKYFSCYFKMISSLPLGYKELCSELDKTGLLYSQARQEGVLVYTAGTLPIHLDASSGRYVGRAFTIIAADHWARVDEISEQLAQFMKQFSTKSFVTK